MTKNLEKLILAEICEVKCIIFKTFDEKIMGNSKSLDYYFPTETNYFSILEANASNLSNIEDDKLIEHIVEAYVKTKYFLDCIRTNNELLEEYNKTIWQGNKIENIGELIQESQTNLVEFKTNTLKNAYMETSYAFDKLLNYTKGKY